MLRRPFTFGLRTKLTFLTEGLIVILIILTGIITTFREKNALENELRKRGLALASDLSKFAARPMLSRDLPTLRRFVNHTMEQDYVLYAMLVDPQGKVVMHSDLTEVGKMFDGHADDLGPATGTPGRMSTRLPEKSGSHCDLSAPVEIAGARLGTVWLGYSYMAVEKEIAEARNQIVLIGMVVIAIGAVASYLLAAYISAPVNRITEATEAVADGDLIPSLTIKRTDEIGRLANSFNKMSEDLAKHRKHLQNLVRERTVELESANENLRQEIAVRERAQQQLGKSRERLRKLASHIQHAREQEAKRIAREIHDELGQALTALKFDLHWVERKLETDPAFLREKIDKMSELIDSTVKSVRRISSELRPGLLDDFGLSAAMEWQSKEFGERTGLECEFASDPENIVLDQDRSVAIFRVFQETLTNIARHADATAVKAVLRETDGDVRLTVIDNGKGITEAQIGDSKSFGVIGMHERVNNLGGDLRIHGAPNQGTTVDVRIPKGEEKC